MQLEGSVIFVKDLERMAAFYGGMLGLQPIEETRTNLWIQFNTGMSTLSLHAIPPEIASGIEISSPARIRELNPIKLVFATDNVESERRRLEQSGVRVILRPWGNCDVVDPEGNVFQIRAHGE